MKIKKKLKIQENLLFPFSIKQNILQKSIVNQEYLRIYIQIMSIVCVANTSFEKRLTVCYNTFFFNIKIFYSKNQNIIKIINSNKSSPKFKN